LFGELVLAFLEREREDLNRERERTLIESERGP
jgi:hypothetical protein